MNTDDMNKYTLSEIYVGMHIDDPDQLSEIYDTWIIMPEDPDGDGYIIGFIGEKTTRESDKVFKKDGKTCVVHNDSIDLLSETLE